MNTEGIWDPFIQIYVFIFLLIFWLLIHKSRSKKGDSEIMLYSISKLGESSLKITKPRNVVFKWEMY